ncbi:MAG: hypothetical protein MI919_13715, partial [Holophagales bacterium]|nr:hypothetical protein [Holophagales bacterium]
WPDDEDSPFDEAELPVLFFEEDPETAASGAILLYSDEADDDPVFDVAPAEEEHAHSTMLVGFARAYRDLEVIAPPSTIELSGGKTATAAIWSYRHDLDDGSTWLRWVRSIVVFWRQTRSPAEADTSADFDEPTLERAGPDVVRVDTWLLVDQLEERRISDPIWNRFTASISYENGSR